MSPIYKFFGRILAFFYSLVPEPSYGLGIAIILLTVLVMVVLFPLTAKQAKSMLAMQRAQPEIKRIQAKHKGDRQKMNEEMMKFYQENKINPLAGCLPLLVQLPIFFSLFQVMRSPHKFVPADSKLFEALCRPETTAARCDNGDLPNHLRFLGMDLSVHATGVVGGLIDALPYFLLVALVVVTGVIQARQSQRNATSMNPQMALITKILPVGFGLFSLQFPAGLVLYFLVSNLWRIGQQELIMRKVTGPMRAAHDALDVKSSVATPTTVEGERRRGLRGLLQLPPSNGDGTDAGMLDPTPKPPERPTGSRPAGGGSRPGSSNRSKKRRRR